MHRGDNLKEATRDSQEGWSRLIGRFPGGSFAAVAFSGGVDSTLVLAAAAEALGNGNVIAVTADSPSLARSELAEAQGLAADIGVRHAVLRTLELENPSYRKNEGDRCYHCKHTLYDSIGSWITSDELRNVLETCGIARERLIIADGLNIDDLGDIRPGRRAADEAGVRHPLVEAGLGKNDVRALARLAGLPNWNKPAMACLASRIPRGTEVTAERLSAIESAESLLIAAGFPGCRVRLHILPESGEKLARVELAFGDLLRFFESDRRALIAALRNLGFAFITVDAEGYRLGGAPNDTPLSEGLNHT